MKTTGEGGATPEPSSGGTTAIREAPPEDNDPPIDNPLHDNNPLNGSDMLNDIDQDGHMTKEAFDRRFRDDHHIVLRMRTWASYTLRGGGQTEYERGGAAAIAHY
jgi:hypothetical protein